MMKQLRDMVNRGLAVFSAIEDGLLCLLLLAMILLACWQIMLRYLFAGGLVWADPLLRYLVLWAGMFGAVVATRRGKHIAIDIISYLVPPRYQAFLKMLINLFAAVVAGVLTHAAVIFVQNERQFDFGAALLAIPFWGWNMVFPLAFGLITLRFVGAVGRSVREMLGTAPGSAGEAE